MWPSTRASAEWLTSVTATATRTADVDVGVDGNVDVRSGVVMVELDDVTPGSAEGGRRSTDDVDVVVTVRAAACGLAGSVRLGGVYTSRDGCRTSRGADGKIGSLSSSSPLPSPLGMLLLLRGSMKRAREAWVYPSRVLLRDDDEW